MQRRPLFWSLVSVICLTGSLYFWHLGDQWRDEEHAAHQAAENAKKGNAASKPSLSGRIAVPSAATTTNHLAYRLTNTTETLSRLIHNDRGILLANALIDTGKPLNLNIPAALRAPVNNGTYIVQSRGPLTDSFRSSLRSSGATIVSYIPNNAYLVRASDTAAQQLAKDPLTQSVLAYEPYYKLDAPLLKTVMESLPVPANGSVNVTLFADAAQGTMDAIKQLGANVISQDRSPFGPVVRVGASEDMIAEMVTLPGVHQISVAHNKKAGNDMFRPRVGVAADSGTPTNYFNLTGSNVLVNINDTGIDTNHPDFSSGRITGDTTNALSDNNGHGTHVAGTILGNGSQSSTVNLTNAYAATNANFRGMATNATGYSMLFTELDSVLQERAAKTNALISNNSWYLSGDSVYDISAASYDAAVRDSLPEVPGSQAITYVFAAGNDGGGSENGSGGTTDSIDSPGTAKNVITVGAIEQPRFITNTITTNGQTYQFFLDSSDSNDQVADFSSRGNVGINIEGQYGRFKPDLIAPGTFVISDRSTTWDTTNYYDPTNFYYNFFSNQVVLSNSFYYVPAPNVPPNAVAVIVYLTANGLSPSPFPNLPIYGSDVDYVTNGTPVGTNYVSVPTNGLILVPYENLYFSISNNTTSTVHFDVTVEFVTTNDDGYFVSLSNLNNSLAKPGQSNYYRFESGTSMSAAGVSGMLACMQEFFQGRLNLTNSPALMKALLINGARPLDMYDLQVNTGLNSEGWGLPQLPNVIPLAFTNLTAGNFSNTIGSMPMQFYDQSLSNALATGQSRTRNLTLSTAAQSQDMRFTLVWTDPPGDPAAGVKLVNDLDLVVTNLDTGDIFYGNDIPGGSFYTQSFFPGGPTNIDSVNNVENVFLQQPLSAHYSFTVIGHRVNVNAVTGNTNNIVQDYALVVSTGDGGIISSNALVIDDTIGTVANPVASVTTLSNGVPLFNQRVGANSQFSGSTNGSLGQWNFYVFTNSLAATNNSYTNVAFLAFVTPPLGVPRMEAFDEIPITQGTANTNATRYYGADVDLYVSTDPGLTNLDPTVIAQTFSNGMNSVTRTGTEKVLITNSFANAVYYIAVKSEDQQGAQYDFFGVATDQPFGQTDSSNNIIVTILTPFPVPIPTGGPNSPQHALILGVSTSPGAVRKVVVTNTVTYPEFGDLIGTLTHGTKTAVLNNHTFFTNTSDPTETFIYDDSGENNIPGSKPSDGPGSLLNFTADNASDGIWMFTMVNDNSFALSGTIDNFSIYLEPQPPTNGGFYETILGNSWFYDYVYVPDTATNFTLTVQSGKPIRLYVREGDYPTFSLYDEYMQSSNGVASVSINKYSSPPLNQGYYYYGIFNPNPNPVTVFVTTEVDISTNAIIPQEFLSRGFEPLLDDAVTYSTNTVGSDAPVNSVEVGVRINHPRESDLVLTLISPQGTRVLLAENRGGLDTNGYGAGYNITNVLGASTAGDVSANTNSIPLTNITSGTLLISYDFYTIPDDLRVYYAGTRIFDSGLISGGGSFSVNFGPGSATNIVILMNEAGSNPASTNATGDRWTYTPAIVEQGIIYTTFTENTNLTTLPIKFAPPPFGSSNTTIAATNILISSFETNAAGIYSNAVDGWNLVGTNLVGTNLVGTNPVTVVTVTNLTAAEGLGTNAGTNVLALHQSGITRVLPTIAGQSYTLTFANRGRPAPTPIGWWKGDGDLSDSSFVGNSANYNGAPQPTYTNGIVSNAFVFTGAGLYVPDIPIYYLSNSLTIEGWINPSQAGQTAALFWRGDTRAGLDPYQFAMNFPNNTPGYPCELDFVITGDGPSNPGGSSTTISAGIQTNVFTYVAGTYSFDTNTMMGTMLLYTNGILASQTTTTNRPLTDLLTNQGPAIGIGDVYDLGGYSIPFFGYIDEITLYSNSISAVQVESIYAAGSAGKCPYNGSCTVSANVSVQGVVTNQTITGIDAWSLNSYTFTPTYDGTVITITAGTNNDGSIQDGMLLDTFVLTQNPTAILTNYYLPEESLNKLIGQSAKGNWLLEVLDNRVGATNPIPTLVSWELSLVLADTVSAAIPLSHAVPQTNSVGPNGTVYYIVNVPTWAMFATNILTDGGGLNLLFNQSNPPTATNNSTTLVAGSGSDILTPNGSPVLLPGQTYYLGVQNTTASTVNFTIEVDFDITQLTNMVPITNNIIASGSIPRYFQFDVDTNATAVEFQLYNDTGDLQLIAKKGAPLPDTLDYDYSSAVSGVTNQTIIVSTNSTPVVLTPGRWYLGVYNLTSSNVSYTIEASEVLGPNIIWLTNAVPTNYFSTPGPALTNFFGFVITNSPPGALFELYKLTGNVDLTLQSNAIPYVSPYLAYSHSSGTNSEQIVLRTNATVTNINGTYYLGVPNNDSTNVNYTIRASVTTNGILVSGIPINITATFPAPSSTNGLTLSFPSVNGEYYEIQTSSNLLSTNWISIYTNQSPGLFDIFTDTNSISSNPFLFYRVIQIPAP